MPRATVFCNGRIYDSHRDGRTSAVGVCDGRIVVVGTDSEVLDQIPDAQRINLEGRFVLPGFIDSHIHLLSYGLTLSRIDLKNVASLEACLRIVDDRAGQTPPDDWVQGRGWNYNIWTEGRLPTRQDLDAVCPVHPAALRSVDGHLTWCNTVALEIAGITRDTPDPDGGRIQRDGATGSPTGILAETAAGLVSRHIPQPSAEARRSALQQAILSAARAGLTGIHDCNGDDIREDLQAIRESDGLSLRFWLMVPASHLDEAVASGRKTGQGDEWLRTGALKVFADGALGPRTAAMLAPYEESDDTGVVVNDAQSLTAIFGRAHANGLEVACHAIGDRAARDVLDAVEAVGHAVPGPFRPRVEHAQILHPDDVPRFARLGAIASMQPIHATSDMHFADRYLGPRARLSYAWRSVLNADARLAFGSDCPVETLSVLEGIHAAVTRQRPDGHPPGGWYPEERLTVHEAIHAYTLGAAYAAGEETEKGSLQPGKLADMVVLSRDITAIPPEEIPHTEVVLTIVGGRVAYDGR